IEMMSMMKYPCLNAIPLLIIDAVGLSAHMVAYTGRGHQIPFVGGIDKHPPFKLLTTKGFYGYNAVVFHGNSIFAVEPFIPQHFYFIFLHKVFKYFCGYVRLEYPHGASIPINGWGSLALVAIG